MTLEEEVKALREELQRPIPPGYAVVPIEPTAEMVEACIEKRTSMLAEGPRQRTAEGYKAMLASAPAIQPQAAASVGEQDSFDALVADAKIEAAKAMRKFPQPNYTLLKVAEALREVVKAAVHLAEGRDTAEHVRDEMRQTIAMLYRLWEEGDGINFVPAISDMLAAPADSSCTSHVSKEEK